MFSSFSIQSLFDERDIFRLIDTSKLLNTKMTLLSLVQHALLAAFVSMSNIL